MTFINLEIIDEKDDNNNNNNNNIFKNLLLKQAYVKNDSKTMTEVLYRATKYMNAEDVLLAWEEKPKKRERQDHT